MGLGAFITAAAQGAEGYLRGKNTADAEKRALDERERQRQEAFRLALARIQEEGTFRQQQADADRAARQAEREAEISARVAQTNADREARSEAAKADREARIEAAKIAAGARVTAAGTSGRGRAEPVETPEQARARKAVELKQSRLSVLERAVPKPPTFPGAFGGFNTPGDSATADQAQKRYEAAVKDVEDAIALYERLSLADDPPAADPGASAPKPGTMGPGNPGAFREALANLAAERQRVEQAWAARGGMPPEVKAELERRYNADVEEIGRQTGVVRR